MVLRVVPVVAGVVLALATLQLVVRFGPVPTSYPAAGWEAAAAGLTAGLGLVAAGVGTTLTRRAPAVGTLALLAGAIWLAELWIGWQDGWPAARSLGMLVAPLLAPVLLHLALAPPGGRLPSSTVRRALGLAYGATGLYTLARALTYDPFLDLECWRNCTDNVFVVAANQDLVRSLDGAWRWLVLGLGVILTATAVWRLLAARAPARAALRPVLIPLAVAGCAEAAYAAVLLRRPEDPSDALFLVVYLARAVALTALAGGIAWTVLRAWRTRRVVARLADELGAAPAPGALRAALARSLGDPDLEVAYWVPDARRYVDLGGRPVEPGRRGRTRTVTPITRGGEPVALVLHDSALYEGEALEREIGSRARMAVDNERLRAQTLAQLSDLKASRTRIVQTGDAERTRLERDLHDGAQQRLLALSYELRLALGAAPRLAPRLAGAIDDARAALAELREIAHGIHPAILGDAGLAPALESFADTAPLPIELAALPTARHPVPAETAAYLAVTEAAVEAARRGTPWLRVDVGDADDVLTIELAAPQDLHAPELPDHIVDRIGALGGRVAHDAHRLTIAIPCA